MSNRRVAQAQIDQLLTETGARDARDAVRLKASSLIELFQAHFGEPTMPINLDYLVSMLGIRRSEDPPVYSQDAELAPTEDGTTVMRVNPDRPETRQRFSIGHEISHTFFPGYELKVQCRPDSRYRNRDDPEDLIESLCDIGAAELLLPLPWFAEDACAVTTGQELVALARNYKASREATARRFVETSKAAVAAVFLSWKLKPTQARDFNPDQLNMFGTTPEEEAWAARQLRIDYAIPSNGFNAIGLFLPEDKSFALEEPINGAARGQPAEGDCDLDLGQSSGRFRVIAIPLYTPADERGPGEEASIVAVIEPISVRQPNRKQRGPPLGPGLFDSTAGSDT